MDEHDCEEDWEFGGERGALGDVFVIGDNFAVEAVFVKLRQFLVSF